MARMENLLTPAETAELLGVAVQTLSLWRCLKRYPLSYIKVGRHVRYDRATVEAFVASRRVEVESVQ